MKKAKNQGGRPPKHKGERLSKNRTFRVRGSLDDYLKDSAEKTGRSVSEEIENRLDRSFYMDAIIYSIEGPNSHLVYALSTAIAISKAARDLDEKDKTRALQAAAVFIIEIISGLKPAGAAPATASEIAAGAAHLAEKIGTRASGRYGLAIAKMALQSIGNPALIEQVDLMGKTLEDEKS
jgi:hypothetical protein